MPPERVILPALIALGFGAGCRARCERPLDCGPGSYCTGERRCQIDCYTNEDCRVPVECRDHPENCPSKGLYCTSRGQCVGGKGSLPEEHVEDVRVVVPEGFREPAATGPVFVVDRLEVAPSGVGFDVDGKGGIDNVLSVIGGEINDALTQGISGGEFLLLIEIVGLDAPYTGTDDSVTVKMYTARDADEPPYAPDNFHVPPGGGGACCEFLVDADSVTIEQEVRQAKSRAGARITEGRLETDRGVGLSFLLTVGTPPFQELRLERAKLAFELDADLGGLRGGLIGAAVTAGSLGAIENPFCGSAQVPCPGGQSATLFDLAASLAGPSPDVDIDRDGRECALDTDGDQVIDLCCDGAPGVCAASQSACGGAVIEGDGGLPCSAGIDDGYSMALRFTAVPARVVGFGAR